MAAIDDFRKAVGAEDTLIDQAVAFITGTPAVVQAAVDLAKQTQSTANDAALAALQADVQAHATALTGALPAVTPTTPAPPVVVPPATPAPTGP